MICAPYFHKKNIRTAFYKVIIPALLLPFLKLTDKLVKHNYTWPYHNKNTLLKEILAAVIYQKLSKISFLKTFLIIYKMDTLRRVSSTMYILQYIQWNVHQSMLSFRNPVQNYCLIYVLIHLCLF